MQKRFIELVSSLVAEIGIECPIVPGESIVSLPFGETSVQIGFFEDRKAIVMQGVAGILPEQGREAFALELLRMNSMFKGTQGAAFGIEDDAVTLQSSIAMEELSDQGFMVQAVTFLEAYAAALEGFAAIAEKADRSFAPAQSDADILAMQNMIRI